MFRYHRPALRQPRIECSVRLPASCTNNVEEECGNGAFEHMLKRLMASDARVLLCGTCMDARGLQEQDLIEGARRSSMDDLALVTLAADKVIAF